MLVSALIGMTIVLSGQAFAEVGEHERVLHADWVKCIEDNAKRFSSGTDAANVVADGVVAACDLKLDAYVKATVKPGRDPSADAATEKLVTDALRKGARNGALEDILRFRSEKGAPRARNK